MTGLRGRPHEAGFTLIELLISLALFALIAAAGVGLVESVLTVQARTGKRLDRLADLQRAMFVLANDLSQAQAGPISGTGTSLTLSRPLPAAGGASLPLGYALVGDVLVRSTAAAPAQRLLDGVKAIRWRYFRPDLGWLDHWPPAPDARNDVPAAISVDLGLAAGAGAPGGTLRRVVALPARP